MSASASMPWGEFSADPRDAATSSLRASDRDRDVVLRVLAESYADGRLTREEYDERAERTTQAKTLGELPPIVEDLVPQSAPRRADSLVPASEELHEQAVRSYESSRRKAASGLVVTSVTLTVIWFVLSGPGGFYWPAFVIAAGLANLLRVLLNKRDLIEEEQRRLERRRRKSLERPSSDSED